MRIRYMYWPFLNKVVRAYMYDELLILIIVITKNRIQKRVHYNKCITNMY